MRSTWLGSPAGELSDPAWLVVAIAACVVAVVVTVLVLGSLRRSVERADRTARENVQAAQHVNQQLSQGLAQFRSQLAEFSHRLSASQGAVGESLERKVTDQLQAMARTVAEQLATSQKVLGEGLAGATEVFGNVQGRLGEVVEMASRMEKLGESVRELGHILEVPKLRGLIGEQTLEAILREVLPARFWSLQHRFSDGRTVDAVVRLGDSLVSVDAKFPLEAYRRMLSADDEAGRDTCRREFVRAVKSRIDEIARRYVRPGEGTLDFALMFIPAEGVFAEVVGGAKGDAESLFEHALARRVLPVSPATIFAYLSTVAMGVRALNVDSRAKDIVRALSTLEQEIRQLREEFTVVGRHLHNASQRHAEAERRLSNVASRIAQVESSGGEDDGCV